ncbi:MAG: Acetophenone carboxylase gamma subunit [Candidatus Heimdallarchaeota archaeon LC_2]|nr:MAG: Acetophenone carboxylase gamma subunit [Candidatus Heimdallarchaeota archaeon LC_2]
MENNNWIIAGIDTGGTFTDTIAISQDEIIVIKVPSTPHNPLLAVLTSLRRLGFVKEVLHGSTVATNAVIERKGAKVALITTKGFKDIIEIGRQNRENIYSLYPTRPSPLVPAELRFEIDERIIADGTIEIPLDVSTIVELIKEMSEKEYDSIAICTLFSFLNPIHEIKIAESLGDQIISVSSVILPEYREYERMSTTVMDAYVKPLMKKYLANLASKIQEEKLSEIFAVMKSSKGLARGKTIAEFPVHTLFSGLAGGIQAAEFTSRVLNIPNLLTLDIGGTSTDVASIVEGRNASFQSLKVGGLPISTPSIDVETIGAGGGSLIQVVSGLLQVGPESAGAAPGPVAYDAGGLIPTVTDADLSFGVLAESLAGGELIMKKSLAEDAMENLADSMNITKTDAIIGSRRIFHENISAALRSVTTQRGLDPRKFKLLAFGGAGPVHACELAELMHISQVVIPPIPGAWAAMGLIGADYSYDTSKGLVTSWDAIDIPTLHRYYTNLEDDALDLAQTDGLDLTDRILKRFLSMRFKGQSYELTVKFSSDKDEIKTGFLDLHKEKYGFVAKNEPIELVAIRATLIIPHDDPIIPKLESKNKPKPLNYTKVLGYEEEAPVYRKDDLGSNWKENGPLIINQLDTTTWIPRNWSAELNQFGFIIANKIN